MNECIAIYLVNVGNPIGLLEVMGGRIIDSDKTVKDFTMYMPIDFLLVMTIS